MVSVVVEVGGREVGGVVLGMVVLEWGLFRLCPQQQRHEGRKVTLCDFIVFVVVIFVVVVVVVVAVFIVVEVCVGVGVVGVVKKKLLLLLHVVVEGVEDEVLVVWDSSFLYR